MGKFNQYLNRFREEKNLNNIEYSEDGKVLQYVPASYFTDIDTFEIPSTVEIIAPLAFEECDGLKRLYIPSSVKTIEDRAFFKCRNIKELIIPRFIDISPSAFFRCGIKKIIYLGKKKEWEDMEIVCPDTIIEARDAYIGAIKY